MKERKQNEKRMKRTTGRNVKGQERRSGQNEANKARKKPPGQPNLRIYK